MNLEREDIQKLRDLAQQAVREYVDSLVKEKWLQTPQQIEIHRKALQEFVTEFFGIPSALPTVTSSNVDPTLLKRVAECDAMLDTAVKQLQVEWEKAMTMIPTLLAKKLQAETEALTAVPGEKEDITNVASEEPKVDEILTQKLKELLEKNTQLAQMLKKIKDTTPKVNEATERTFNMLKELKQSQEKYEQIASLTTQLTKNEPPKKIETDRNKPLSSTIPK